MLTSSVGRDMVRVKKRESGSVPMSLLLPHLIE